MASQLSSSQGQPAPATDQCPFMNISLKLMAPLTNQSPKLTLNQDQLASATNQPTSQPAPNIQLIEVP